MVLFTFGKVVVNMQIIDSFQDSVMSFCLTKTEIIGGSVDGTVRTFDIRIGRYVDFVSEIVDKPQISMFFYRNIFRTYHCFLVS